MMMKNKELEDFFKTDEFKKMSFLKRLILRIKIAFIQSLKLY
jgi:hypothetical protein